MLLGSFHVQNYDLYQFVALFFNINLMYSACKRLRKQEGVSKVLNKEIRILIKVIVQRTQSNQTAYAIRSDGVRNPIGRRSLHDDRSLSIKDEYVCSLTTDRYIINGLSGLFSSGGLRPPQQQGPKGQKHIGGCIKTHK